MDTSRTVGLPKIHFGCTIPRAAIYNRWFPTTSSTMLASNGSLPLFEPYDLHTGEDEQHDNTGNDTLRDWLPSQGVYVRDEQKKMRRLI